MSKAYMSAPDSGVTALRPDLYPADLAWLTRTAMDEARAILAEREPAARTSHYEPLTRREQHWKGDEDRCGRPLSRAVLPPSLAALADALAAFVALEIQ